MIVTAAAPLLHFTERASDSPFVERVWCSHSERAGTFLSVAQCHVELVITRHQGSTFATLRGPETRASLADCPAEAEWVAVRFSLGTFLPALRPAWLRDRHDLTLPSISSCGFLLDGSAWEFPTFENAETFVARLARRGVIAHDDGVDLAMRGVPLPRSLRSRQRRFQHATGLSDGAARRIARAREATLLLRDGVPILDVVDRAGYYDQAHLTRSLKQLIGQTPGDVLRAQQQLSFLYKTE